MPSVQLCAHSVGGSRLVQRGNTWSVQVPAPGWLWECPASGWLPGYGTRCAAGIRAPFGTSTLDTGKQLRSLPKEFLPSKELGFLTAIHVHLLWGGGCSVCPALGFTGVQQSLCFPETALGHTVKPWHCTSGFLKYLFSLGAGHCTSQCTHWSLAGLKVCEELIKMGPKVKGKNLIS